MPSDAQIREWLEAHGYGAIAKNPAPTWRRLAIAEIRLAEARRRDEIARVFLNDALWWMSDIAAAVEFRADIRAFLAETEE